MQTFTYKEKEYSVVEHFHGERLIGSDNIGKFYGNFYVRSEVDMTHKGKVISDLKHLHVPYVVINDELDHILLKEPDNIDKHWPNHALGILGMVDVASKVMAKSRANQEHILAALEVRPDSTMTEISNAIDLSKSQTDKYVQKLIHGGKVKKSGEIQPYTYRLCS